MSAKIIRIYGGRIMQPTPEGSVPKRTILQMAAEFKARRDNQTAEIVQFPGTRERARG